MPDDFFDELSDLEELGREQEAIEIGADPLIGEWRKLLEISTRIGVELQLESLLRAVMDAAIEITEAERGFLILLDAEGEPEVRIAHNLEHEEIQDIQGSISRTVIGQILSERKPMLINDVENNELLSRQVSVRNLQLKSVMGAPIICRGNLLGMAYVDSSSLAGIFSQKEFAIFVTFVNLAAVAIDNAKLFESLSDSSERYRSLQEYNENILRTIPSGVLILNRENRIEYYNKGAEAIFPGLKDKNLALEDIISHESLREGLRQMQAGQKPDILQIEIEDRYYEADFFSVLEREGKVGVSISDITARKNLEKKYAEESKRALVTQLAGYIAHEISNQLFPIQGRAQLAVMKLKQDVADLDPEILKSLQVIEDQVQKISRIVENLRHLSRPAKPKLENVDLSDVLKQAMEVMSTTAGKIKRFRSDDPRARFCLQTSYHSDHLMIRGDPDQLQQVFMNLIINAVHALEEAGKGTLLVGTGRRKGRAFAYVEDDGPGIPEQLREKIFEPYFTTKEEGKGTGLGMPIVKNAVQAHKGELIMKTEVGRGTRFEILLPLKEKSQSARD